MRWWQRRGRGSPRSQHTHRSSRGAVRRAHRWVASGTGTARGRWSLQVELENSPKRPRGISPYYYSVFVFYSYVLLSYSPILSPAIATTMFGDSPMRSGVRAGVRAGMHERGLGVKSGHLAQPAAAPVIAVALSKGTPRASRHAAITHAAITHAAVTPEWHVRKVAGGAPDSDGPATLDMRSRLRHTTPPSAATADFAHPTTTRDSREPPPPPPPPLLQQQQQREGVSRHHQAAREAMLLEQSDHTRRAQERAAEQAALVAATRLRLERAEKQAQLPFFYSERRAHCCHMSHPVSPICQRN